MSPTLKRIFALLLPSLLLAACVEWLLVYEPFSSSDSGFVAQAQIASDTTGQLHTFFDFGSGFHRESMRDFWVRKGAPSLCVIPIPQGNIHRLTFVPFDDEARLKLLSLRILDPEGHPIHAMASPNAPAQQSAIIELAKPLNTAALDDPYGLWATAQFSGIATLFVALFWWLGKRPAAARERWLEWWRRRCAWCAARPGLSLLGAAVIAVLISCHPVVFFGKSFASPNNGALCLYDSFPTIPGVSGNSPVESWTSSDVQALLWAHLPYSVVESQSILRDREFPLWLRDDMCGVTLLGQGQSMIGDPLQWLPILAHGAAWAWDVKFLLAKTLFAFGVGLLALSVTRHLPTSALLAFSSAFIGFFSYRFMHAAVFSLSYAPWILLCWVWAANASSVRRCALWALASVGANWMELNSGTAKEASMLLIFVNGAGVLMLLLSGISWRERFMRLATMVAGCAIFAAISAPLWLVFLDALRSSATLYDVPTVNQIQPGLLLGLFDDLFYRELMPAEWHIDPSLNFLTLIGVLWAIADFAKLRKEPVFLAAFLGALPLLAMIFGIIPPEWVEMMPLIKNVWHVDNTFSCPLFILLFVAAAFGLRNCVLLFASEGEWQACWKRTLIFLGILAAIYFGSVNAHARWDSFAVQANRPFTPSSFFIGYSLALFAAVALLPLIAKRIVLGQGSRAALITAAILGLFAVHFRHSMWLETKFDYYVVNPRERVNLQAHSAAVDFIQSRQSEPGRVASVGKVLRPGFNTVYGLEAGVGADAVANKWYGEWLDAAGLSRSWMWTNEIPSAGTQPHGRFFDAMNVRYFLSSGEVDPSLKKVLGADLNVYESSTAWPRAFFTDRVSIYQAPAEFAALVDRGDGRPVAGVQGPISELASLGADQASRQIVPAKNYRLTANSTAFQIDAPAAGLAVLGEAFESGSFRVSLNGKAAQCLRVNHAFKGVFVPAGGRFEIVFSYWPRLLTPALWISGAGCMAAILAGLWLLRGGKSAYGMKTAFAVPQNVSPSRETPSA